MKEKAKELPEKFLHICEVCGKTEMLSVEEAFNDGWDYPPRIGTFGVLSPRTCGDCAMTDTLWWRLINKQTDMEHLSEKDIELIKRIKGESENLYTE